ncbi:3-oxo-5-alpha-steroid 4-dehydrogenase [Cardiosporidium cionae]|uniref:3-oxo-5-alpha-steroid 4-dehydrogenase n=1 Tax=Cardiosporidium cionae TaxID=476202 RepID=A0ABQ7J9E9_9APIC|nr:3-oxo-5-alpha-steroid 4-dehydrogenase [Cardiosporidium cionae]|eukprot:KAF8820641.1 3-oxo-5-alpha-steroid 4-dehydrogenase [Cardiosporidium cionae]
METIAIPVAAAAQFVVKHDEAPEEIELVEWLRYECIFDVSVVRLGIAHEGVTLVVPSFAAMMKITLRKRSGNHLDTFEVTESTTVEEFKAEFYKKYHYYPERQWWNIGKVTGKALKEGTLVENGITEGSFLYFKDMGVQISWRLVFVLEYLGPLLIFPLFYFFPSIYVVYDTEKSLVQKIAFFLALFHYFKREMETLFVHRFSNATMPIFRVPINCGHYWGLFGAAVGYYLFHPKYTSPWRDDQIVIIYGLALSMLIFEFLNFKTHLVLRHLRPRGTKLRGVPYGWGFDTLSCANYFWEILAWISFCLLVCSLTVFLSLFSLSFLLFIVSSSLLLLSSFSPSSLLLLFFISPSSLLLFFISPSSLLPLSPPPPPLSSPSHLLHYFFFSFLAWLFTLVAFLQMAQWALKKHFLYMKDPNYPKGRKALIPSIL